MRSSLPLRSATTLAAALALLAACGSNAASEAAASASASGVATWVTHRDAAGAFEARFPTPPTLQEINPPQKAGEMQLAIKNAQVADDTRLLLAAKVLMTDVGKYDCADGLKGMVESSLSGMGCTADKNEPREMQGLPGREISFTCQKRPMRGLMRIGCDARKASEHAVTAYSMMAAYKNESWNAEEAEAFLNSFALLASAAP